MDDLKTGELVSPEPKAKRTKKEIEAEALTPDEFFDLPDLSARGGKIKVSITGQKKYNEQKRELMTITNDKEIVVAPKYWFSIHRGADGEPTDPQQLVGYFLDGVYSDFKK